MRLFDHIDLRVRSSSEAKGFYSRISSALGFPHIEESPDWLCFCSRPYPEIGEYLAITEDAKHVASAICIAFWCSSKADVDRLAGLLSAAGVLNFEPPAMYYQGHYAFYFEDPSGNRFEVCHREYDQMFDQRIAERPDA